MPFSLWFDGGEFGFLDPLQNQHTRRPCILAQLGNRMVLVTSAKEMKQKKWSPVCGPLFTMISALHFVNFRVWGIILTYQKPFEPILKLPWSPWIVWTTSWGLVSTSAFGTTTGAARLQFNVHLQWNQLQWMCFFTCCQSYRVSILYTLVTWHQFSQFIFFSLIFWKKMQFQRIMPSAVLKVGLWLTVPHHRGLCFDSVVFLLRNLSNDNGNQKMVHRWNSWTCSC